VAVISATAKTVAVKVVTVVDQEPHVMLMVITVTDNRVQIPVAANADRIIRTAMDNQHISIVKEDNLMQ
jgi:hypothetical protein